MDKELKEFWEWCGFRVVTTMTGKPAWVAPDKKYPELSSIPEEPIDLNNLFKYAIPKLDSVKLITNDAPSGDRFYNAEVELDGIKKVTTSETPAQALYQAINEVRKNG